MRNWRDGILTFTCRRWCKSLCPIFYSNTRFNYTSIRCKSCHLSSFCYITFTLVLISKRMIIDRYLHWPFLYVHGDDCKKFDTPLLFLGALNPVQFSTLIGAFLDLGLVNFFLVSVSKHAFTGMSNHCTTSFESSLTKWFLSLIAHPHCG